MNLDLSLSNRFALSERFELGLRIDAFNALNGMNWVTPQLNEAASDFGKTYTEPTTAVRFSTPSVLSSERTSRGGRTTSDPLSMAP
jgi:hypothetical protein